MYYSKHIFLCTNQKAPGKPCCANQGGEAFFNHMKAKLQELDLHGAGKIRISKTGCLGRCSLGPCIALVKFSSVHKTSAIMALLSAFIGYSGRRGGAGVCGI